jgi:hypothetical protein
MSAQRKGQAMRVAWAMTVAMLFGACAVAAAQPTEGEVKAAFLYHFAQLVTWPDSAEGGPEDPLVIAVLGPSPVGDRLEAMVAHETVRGRRLVVKRPARLGDMERDPHILFVGRLERAEIGRVIDSVQASPVLTVSDAPDFAQRGGMIGFRLTEDSRVAFDINLKAVRAAGLRMSSQLLKIARLVEADR